MKTVAIFLCALLLACAETTAPEHWTPPGAVEYAPPVVYHYWWEEAEECSGRSRDFGEVRWFYVPGVFRFDHPTYGRIAGLWVPPSTAYIAEYRRLNPELIKHEGLHALGFSHDASGPPYPWPFTGCATQE